MRRFENEFRDSLTASVDEETGKIWIGSVDYDVDVVLEEVDPNVFNQAYVDFLGGLQRGWVEKVDQILRDIPGNLDNFRALKRAYNQRIVTPFVGAGMSLASGFPTWRGFLWELQAQSDVDSGVLRTLIDDGQFEVAAQLICDVMGDRNFARAIENRFAHEEECLGCVSVLPDYFEGSVITTNLDDQVYRLYESRELPFQETLTGDNAVEFPRHNGRRRTLVRLHGTAYAESRHIIIRDEYEQAYNRDDSLVNAIDSITRQPLLFIGCSLTVDRTIQAMIELYRRRVNQGPHQHFAFLPFDSETDIPQRQAELGQANISIIWYEDGDHDECIEGLLLKLKEPE